MDILATDQLKIGYEDKIIVDDLNLRVKEGKLQPLLGLMVVVSPRY